MLRLLFCFLWWFGAFFRTRHDLALELAALRQQVGVLKRKNPKPTLDHYDRLFWLALRRVCSRWADVLLVVKPDTVVRWHRAGFRFYWRMLSRHRPGRPKLTLELRQLISRIASENPTWGAPRIHGELLKLGFDLSERTVSRYVARLGNSPYIVMISQDNQGGGVEAAGGTDQRVPFGTSSLDHASSLL